MRGAGMTEYVIGLLLVGLGALGTYRFFGARAGSRYECAGMTVDRMGGGPPIEGCTGSVQEAAAEPPPTALPTVAAPPPTPVNCVSQLAQCTSGCPGSGDPYCSLICVETETVCFAPDRCGPSYQLCKTQCESTVFRATEQLSKAADLAHQAAERLSQLQAANAPQKEIVQAQAEYNNAVNAVTAAQVQLTQAYQELPACRQQCEDQQAACLAAGNPP